MQAGNSGAWAKAFRLLQPDRSARAAQIFIAGKSDHCR
jgi:hypothetical protein